MHDSVCSDMRPVLVALCAAVLAVALFGQKGSESELWDDLDYSLKGATSLHPKNGFVPDEVTAIKIAEAVATAQWGEKQISAERPFKARLRGSVWTVMGTLHPQGIPGGTAVVKLNKATGAVMFAIHQQ